MVAKARYTHRHTHTHTHTICVSIGEIVMLPDFLYSYTLSLISLRVTGVYVYVCMCTYIHISCTHRDSSNHGLFQLFRTRALERSQGLLLHITHSHYSKGKTAGKKTRQSPPKNLRNHVIFFLLILLNLIL